MIVDSDSNSRLQETKRGNLEMADAQVGLGSTFEINLPTARHLTKEKILI